MKTRQDKSQVHMFLCPAIYDPGHQYTETEITQLLKTYQSLWCYFAQETRQKRCILAVDFRPYEGEADLMAVYSMHKAAIREMGEATDGAELMRAYRRSRVGKSILVFYNMGTVTGWLKLAWQLSPAQAKLYRQGKIE